MQALLPANSGFAGLQGLQAARSPARAEAPAKACMQVLQAVDGGLTTCMQALQGLQVPSEAVLRDFWPPKFNAFPLHLVIHPPSQ